MELPGARTKHRYIGFPSAENEKACHGEPTHADDDAYLGYSEREWLWAGELCRFFYVELCSGFPERLRSGRGREEFSVPRNIFVPQRNAKPEDAPDACHNPSRSRISVENRITKPDLVKCASKEWTGGHADTLSHDQKPCESSPSSDTDNTRV